MTVVTEIRHLQLLLAIDEEGTLHAAARRLHLSPSALSQQLRDLEQRLGGALFQRQWRRLVATPAARHLIEGARGLVTELERLEGETRALMGGAHATLRIAMICQETYRWLPDVLLRLATQAPSVEVSIITDVVHDPTEALAERKIDVALVAGKRMRDRRTKDAHVFRDELVAVVSSKHPWAGAKSVPVRAFAKEQLYCDEGAVTKRAPLGRLFAEVDVSPRKISIVPTSGTVALELVRANLGVTVMPCWAVAPFAPRDGLALVRVGPRGLWLEWAALTRNEPASPGLATFLEIMKACVSNAAASRKASARRSPRVPDG
ncbi:MAG TPA: LysR family transcriptional regulator [Opitutaceae bacterium]|nr:LysR family transcriptional regulator [Opitutaceae bacterium]